MNRDRLQNLLAKRWLMALAAGLLWALAFPDWNLPGLAWAVPGLLIALGSGVGGHARFRLGWLAGFAFNLASLYWLLFIPVAFLPILAWVALSAYLSLFPAVWLWFCWRLLTPRSVGHDSEAGRPANRTDLAEGCSLLCRSGWALACAAAWVALEFLRAHLFSGFPWSLLGVSQLPLKPLIQIVSITGIYGLSFLLAWSGVSLFLAAATIVHRPGRHWLWAAELLAPTTVVAAATLFGFSKLARVEPSDRSLNMVLVQPSIPQTVKWDPEQNREAFTKILELSNAALALKPDVLVWPEASTPTPLRYSEEIHREVTSLARKHRVWFILGGEDAEPLPDPGSKPSHRFFNSAFLIDPDGEVVDKYDKRALVIFGEYIPLSRWLPFLKWFTPIEGGFARGAEPGEFHIPEHRATASILICFEDVFPYLGRKSVTPETDFLLNLTNDGWFGASAAQRQHAANAAFRAVENGVPLVRCTNNGLTCWIDARGDIQEVHAGDSGDIYGAGFQAVTIPLPASSPNPRRTFYHRHGKWRPWLCIVASLALWARQRFPMPPDKTSPPASLAAE